MKLPKLVLAGALGILISVLMMGVFGADSSEPQGSKASEESPTLGAIVAQLDLGKMQERRLRRIFEREADRVDQLEEALIANEQRLRGAEVSQPFDGRRVNRWVVRGAEISAYLRGTESRVVSEIVKRLTPEQQARLSRLRASASSVTAEPRTRQVRSAYTTPAGKPSFPATLIPLTELPDSPGRSRAGGTWSLVRWVARGHEAGIAVEDSH